MSEKKELKVEQLEKVNGGYPDPENINWLFSKNETAYIILTDNTQVEGKVSKKGLLGSVGGDSSRSFDLYYIESTENTNVNGWYPGDKFSNKTVSISNKLRGLAEPAIKPW